MSLWPAGYISMVDPVMLEWCGGGAGSSLCWPGSSPAMLFYAVLPHNIDVDADDIYTRPLAIRMRYMCIYACAVTLIGGRAGLFYRFTDSWSLTSLLRVGHRVATLLDSTRESILALRYNFWRLQGTQSWSR